MSNILFTSSKHKCFSNDNSQYSNLNLNQKFKCSDISTIQSHSKQRSDGYGNCGDIERTNILPLNKSSSIGLSFKEANNFTTNDDVDRKATKRSQKVMSPSTTKSTLSIRIAEFENCDGSIAFVSKMEKEKSLKNRENVKQIISASTFFIQNPFEFPRQQNYEVPDPEVSQYRASQRLSDSNESNHVASRSTRHVNSTDESRSNVPQDPSSACDANVAVLLPPEGVGNHEHQLYEAELARTRKGFKHLLCYPCNMPADGGPPQRYFLFLITTKQLDRNDSAFTQIEKTAVCRTCEEITKNVKVWKIKGENMFVDDPAINHFQRCTGFAAKDKCHQVKKNEFFHLMKNKSIEAFNQDELFDQYVTFMGEYIEELNDPQKYKLKHNLWKSFSAKEAQPIPLTRSQKKELESDADERRKRLPPQENDENLVVKYPRTNDMGVYETPIGPQNINNNIDEQYNNMEFDDIHELQSASFEALTSTQTLPASSTSTEINLSPSIPAPAPNTATSFRSVQIPGATLHAAASILQAPYAALLTNNSFASSSKITSTTSSSLLLPLPASATSSSSTVENINPNTKVSFVNQKNIPLELLSSSPTPPSSSKPAASSTTTVSPTSPTNSYPVAALEALPPVTVSQEPPTAGKPLTLTATESSATTVVVTSTTTVVPKIANIVPVLTPTLSPPTTSTDSTPVNATATAKQLETALTYTTYGCVIPSIIPPVYFYQKLEKSRRQASQIIGEKLFSENVLHFEFPYFYSQGLRKDCAFNTVAFTELWIQREHIIPLWEGGRLYENGILNHNLLLPRFLFDLIADGLKRGDNEHRNICEADKQPNGYSVARAQQLMKSKLDSAALIVPPSDSKVFVKKLYTYLTALIQCKELDGIRNRYYNIGVVRAGMLIIFDSVSGALICVDGHAHDSLKKGAFIALSTVDHLDDFCNHIVNAFVPYVAEVDLEKENFFIVTAFCKDAASYPPTLRKNGTPVEWQEINEFLKKNHLNTKTLFGGLSYNEYESKLEIVCDPRGKNLVEERKQKFIEDLWG